MIETVDLRARNDNICLLRADGMTYQSIGDLYGISNNRARQIFENDRYKKAHKEQKRVNDLKVDIEKNKRLNNGNVCALADYLRHKVSVANPKDQYFVDMAATELERLANKCDDLTLRLAIDI